MKRVFWGLVVVAAVVGFLTCRDNVSAQTAASPQSPSATVLALWTFETAPPPDTTDSTTCPTVAADSGALVAGSLFSAVHGNAATDWTTPTGNGSANSVSANTWGVADYFQFKFSTTGYTGISVAWDQISSSTGPRDFKVQYSTDGTNFTDATGTNSTYVVLVNASPNTWNGTTPVAASSYTLDLSGVTALNNQPTVYVRLALTSTASAGGATIAAGGTGRIDNFAGSGTSAGPPAHVQHFVDFDGDGKTDYSVIRDEVVGANQHQRVWYNLLNTNTFTYTVTNWGLTTIDFEEPGDFDGDGKSDIAVWRSSTNSYYILRSQDQTFQSFTFSAGGADPGIVGDYNGDGKADPAVIDFTGGTSVWKYIPSAGTGAGIEVQVIWGYDSDFPVAGDFNGDGKADFCAQRDLNDPDHHAAFYIHYGDGVNVPPVQVVNQTAYFGRIDDSVVPGDYDGDGKTDVAVAIAGATNYEWWYAKSSSGGAPTYLTSWGLASGDRLTPGDYDGDGKTDPAVWRTSSGYFYVFGSQAGNVIAANWGKTGDIPTAEYNNH
ncbi:MAG TPA: VCBS repeat-containing protein [Pyrinomonadaceae bacterium]|nr:VCBS repeat-containing protein [Pyrinomonadaceae bacterium]